MTENRQAVKVRNKYLKRFKEVKKWELDSKKSIIDSVNLPWLMIFYTLETLIDKLTIEGSCERVNTKMYVFSGFYLFMILWFIFAYRWLKDVNEEREQMDSGEHQMMNCDEDKFDENIQSVRESINSLNKKSIAVCILYGTIVVLLLCVSSLS